MVIRTKDALQNLGAKVLGVVLNNAYMKPRTRNFAPSVAVHKRPQGELEAAEFQTALNRLRGNDPY
jgi:Mrp family chromosome partitioning ATPase